MAGLAARVMAVGEASVAGVLATVDDELEVAHRDFWGHEEVSVRCSFEARVTCL